MKPAFIKGLTTVNPLVREGGDVDKTMESLLYTSDALMPLLAVSHTFCTFSSKK